MTHLIFKKKLLNKFTSDSNFVELVEEVPSKRVEVINYYDTYMPDSAMYFCPVSNQSYIISMQDEGNSIRVDSPIEETIVRRRYIFSPLKLIIMALLMMVQKVGIGDLTCDSLTYFK